MKRIFLAAAFVLFTSVAHAQTVTETPIGFVGFEGNEESVGSKIDDPAKVRITVPISEHGGGGGVVSFNASRVWGAVQFGGNQTEMAMLRVEQASDVRGLVDNPKAEFNFLCNDGSGTDDAAMRKCLSFTYSGITAISPGIANSLRAITAGTPVVVSWPNKLVSPDGRVELDIQNADALNMTLYLDGVALWSVVTGTTPEGKAKGLR